MKIKPLGNYALIKELEESNITKSGIVTSVEKEKSVRGTVEAVGHVEGIKVGDVVLFKKWGGYEVKVDREEMLLIQEEDILAVEEE